MRIAITGIESESRVAMTHADASGRFLVELPDGDYALAMTSRNEFAFVERVKAPATSLAITLSAGCAPVVGRLSSGEHSKYGSSTVMLERRSTSMGDAFPVAVAADGRFTACLPPGRYVASVQGSTTSIATPVAIPVGGPLSLDVYPVATVEAPPPVAAFAGATFDEMVKALSHRGHVLGLGEANHGTADFYVLRGALSLALARTGGLRLVLIEADAVGMVQIDDYVQGREVAIERAEARAEVLSLSARAILAASSLQHQLDHARDASSMSWDRIMAEMGIQVWQLAGQGRMCVWAHNGHVARKALGSADSTGGYLAERFGREYYAIAFLSYDGSARAWGVGNRGVVPHDLRTAPAFNLESVIMTALGFPEVAWVRFDASSAALQKWLEIPRYVREFGSAYVASETQTLRPVPESFDAAVVVRRSSPSTPTLTGVRGPQ